jgi:coproporphyrinogen III oxidase
MRVALFEPDIPQNAAAIMRTCACLGLGIDIIEPCGFLFSDAGFRRAGLDYRDKAEISRHSSWAAFLEIRTDRLVLLTTKASVPYTELEFSPRDTLLLGRESAGVPEHVHQTAGARVKIPMRPGLRSLNVAQACAMVTRHCVRQKDSLDMSAPAIAANDAESPKLADERKARARAWFAELRDSICADFEAIEREYAGAPDLPPGRFERKDWKRPTEDGSDGGGGTMSVMRGRVFEKVGVNISTVYGKFEPQFAKEIPGAKDDPSYWASGISLVAHARNPRVSTAHFNTRHIRTQKIWFGGGGDLTPMLNEKRERNHPDTVLFHGEFRNACDKHDPGYYERFSKWCDEYFFIKHRNETRGTGGIFYDYLEGDWERNFAFTRDVGLAFLAAYGRIVRGAMNEPWTEQEKNEQLVRRGRYAEFNLVYDRGTRFGLMTGGNTEAILMSLPPVVHWP